MQCVRNLIERDLLETQIIVGSIRKPQDVTEALKAGSHIVTIPYKIFLQMPYHAKTESTLKEFDDAWVEFQKDSLSANKSN